MTAFVLYVGIALLLLIVLIPLLGALRPRSTTPPPPPTPESHDDLYRAGVALVEPFMHLTDRRQADAESGRGRSDIQRGIALLRRAVELNPGNWAAWWVIGKGFQALSDHEQAYAAFRRSAGINETNPDVFREFMFECLSTGRAAEGVAAARRALLVRTDEPGLRANLALALLLSGDVDAALLEAEAALAADPSDEITGNLAHVVREVKDGRRPRPTRLPF